VNSGLEYRPFVVLTGGTGGAKFVAGLEQSVAADRLAVVINTGDDLRCWGLHVSPDIDSVVYSLAGLLSRERGWGVEADSFHCLDQMRKLGAPGWFQLGDRDLALHLQRTQLLAEGQTLSQATLTISDALGVRARILPMSDQRVETRVVTDMGELSFQEYFVRERYRPSVRSVRFEGHEEARPAPGVVESIAQAEAVFIAPSNPITSIGPILSVRGIREALQQTCAPVVAISPIVAGAAVSGPAGELMASQGLPVSIAGVAQAYAEFLDVLIADEADRGTVVDGIDVVFTNTIMKSSADRVALAEAALLAAGLCEGKAVAG
jgi:LPPG:FO 2-phospho-L-lactate transferase